MSLRFVVGLLVFLVACAASSQVCTGVNTYYLYSGAYGQFTGPVTWSATAGPVAAAAACEAFAGQHGEALADAWIENNPDYTNVHHEPECALDRLRVFATYIPNGQVSQATIFLEMHQVGGQCPPETGCDTDHPNVGRNFSMEGLEDFCDSESQCLVKAGMGACVGATCVSSYTITNQECTPGGGSDDPPPPQENCVTSGDAEFCKSGQDGDRGPNCGFLNGNFLCLDETDDDGCQVFGDSSRVCGPEAPTPPVPDNGTPGNPAPPDGQIGSTGPGSGGQTTLYNYYNQATVGGSNRLPGASGDNPHDGDDDGDGAGNGAGSGDGDGEGECPEGATCDGALPGAGEFDEVCTFGQCAQQFFTRVQSAPLVAGVLNVGAGFPSGSCPNWTLEAFGEGYLLSGPMCDIWESVAPLLSALFLVIWAWVATRIVLSA